MFRLEHPEYVWGLVIVPLLFLVSAIHRRWLKADWARWGSPGSNVRVPAFGVYRRNGWEFIAVFGLFVLALTNPQWGTRTASVESGTADVYLLFDISNSMLAEDIAPSRFERARQLAIRLADDMKTERLGLVFFAGHAYLQSPLTSDWQAIRLFLQAADPSQAGTQGTAIGEAVRLVLRNSKPGEATGGMLILITDGEDHDEDASGAVADAARAGWVTHVVGIGTEAGGPIPVSTSRGRDVKRDAQGEPVHTRLNSSLLRQLANTGGGSYFDMSGEADIAGQLRDALAGYGRRQAGKRVFTEHRSLFGWFLLPGILALLTFMALKSNREIA